MLKLVNPEAPTEQITQQIHDSQNYDEPDQTNQAATTFTRHIFTRGKLVHRNKSKIAEDQNKMCLLQCSATPKQ
jgi:hypothetical protein